MGKPHPALTRGVTDEIELGIINSQILSAGNAIAIFREYIHKRLKSAKPCSRKDYDNPNWAYKQADFIGYERACNELLDILTIQEN